MTIIDHAGTAPEPLARVDVRVRGWSLDHEPLELDHGQREAAHPSVPAGGS